MGQTCKSIRWDCCEEVKVQVDAACVIGEILWDLCELQIAAPHRLSTAVALRAVAALGATGGSMVEAEGHQHQAVQQQTHDH